GAHFSKDSVNRPGFAKMFFDASSEEREHALKLIEYLLMRGELTTNVTSLITIRCCSLLQPSKLVPESQHAAQVAEDFWDSG
ncbi:jg20597, partial [Pararge aegeria aegeria]